MARISLHLLAAVSLCTISAGIYSTLINRDGRYDLFDLLKRSPITAAIGVEPPAGGKKEETTPLLRAVPLD